jgi:hypothetical protein
VRKQAWLLLLASCASAAPPAAPSADGVASGAADVSFSDTVATKASPTWADLRLLVPSPELPASVSPHEANNNLDVVRAGDQTLLAFRTAPNHFASPEARIEVVATPDDVTWLHEATFAPGSDVREPRLLALNGRTFLYFAVLAPEAGTFVPQGARYSERKPDGSWTPAKPCLADTFIPWRIHAEGGKAWMTGYTNGDKVYADAKAVDGGKAAVQVHWLQSSDGEQWQPVVPGKPVVYEGGVSEVDVALLANGGLVAVGRAEAGDALGFGSVVCSAPSPASPWQCQHDGRKFDSPLLFRQGNEVWLIARRNVTPSGLYDVANHAKPANEQYAYNQLDYWGHPKRCSLWRVEPSTRAVIWTADLPGRGDTCFASVLPVTDRLWQVYNYSSPLEGDDDPAWFAGQHGPTRIYRAVVDFGP